MTRLLVKPIIAVAATGVALASCGGGAGDAVVVRVNGHAITRASLEHWTKVEAVLAYDYRPTKPVPKGVVPDPPRFASCIAYLRTLARRQQGGAGATGAQLMRQCHERYEQLQHDVLDILIGDYWVRGEGAARGVTVTEAEVDRTLRYEFPQKGSLERFAALSGETVAEQRFLLYANLLQTKLQAQRERSLASRGLSGERMQRELARAAAEFAARWTPRTDCSPGYVVRECRQYAGAKA